MIIENITKLRENLGRGSCLLGLDLGSKTVGMALSDASFIVATPYKTLRRAKFADLVNELQQFIVEHEVGGLVIGLPLGMDGSEGPRCRSSRAFADNILQAFAGSDQEDMPIFFHDERLSTAAVERMLIKEVDMTRKRRAQVVDKAAAAYILQGALDIMAAQEQ